MKKLILVLIMMGAFVLKSGACLNYYYTLDKEGDLHLAGEGSDLLKPFNKNFNKELIITKMKKLETKMKKEHSYMLLSDYAVSLLKLGKPKEGLEILVQLYANYPNEYKIASNLGTAYELNGQVDSALKYIKRGLQLNPNDHEGSEWVHVKILETKKHLAKDSAWLQSHTVLQLSDQQKQDTVIQKQILIQLQERFPFSPGPDPIMASLFVDLGDISANTNSVEYAKVFYQIAKEYYGDKSKSLSDKVKEMQKLSDQYSTVRPPSNENVKYKGGENVKLGTISYKTLLSDNDPKNYQIDWSQINTDVKSLLADVNLTMTVQQALDTATRNQTDDLKLVNDSIPASDVKDETKTSGGKENMIWIIIGSVLLALTLFFFFRKSK